MTQEEEDEEKGLSKIEPMGVVVVVKTWTTGGTLAMQTKCLKKESRRAAKERGKVMMVGGTTIIGEA